MKLYDAHIHWQDELLASCLEEDLALATSYGIEKWICAGTKPEDWEFVQKLATRFPSFIPAYGLHPWSLENLADGWKDKLASLLSDPRALVGEIGLDALKETPMGIQKEIFLFQWRLALKFDRPVIVHCRKAYSEILELIKKEGGPRSGFLLHSYSGSAEQVQEFASLGAYFSVSGNITSPTNKKAQRNLKSFPLERLLIETDAPVMQPFVEGKKLEGINRAQNLLVIFKALALSLGLEEEKLALILEKNFIELTGTLRRS